MNPTCLVRYLSAYQVLNGYRLSGNYQLRGIKAWAIPVQRTAIATNVPEHMKGNGMVFLRSAMP